MHDNAQRFRYEVLKDTVLPKEHGGMERVRVGDILTGPHYKQFLQTGFIREEDPKPVAAPPAEKSEPEKVEETAGTSSLEKPAEEPVEEPVDEGETQCFTRSDLEKKTKSELQALAESLSLSTSGSKNKIIKTILGE